MQVIQNHENIDSNIKRGIALGNFDGVHIGHQKLINSLLNVCKSNNLQSCIYTFINHTMPIISNTSQLQYITNIGIKKRIFQDCGIDILVLDEFNQKLMALSPEKFVEDILVKILNCKIAIVGFDYRFGYKGRGDTILLKELGKKYGFEVIIIDAVMMNEKKVSSSHIRGYLKDGNIKSANEFLGRYFSLCSKVIHGDARGGSLLGFPTANIEVDPLQIIPKPGVYATLVKVNNEIYMGATSVGTKPTFKGTKQSVETFIIDYSGDLYNEYIEVSFVKMLRGEFKYESPQILIEQINKDIQNVKICLQNNCNVLK